MDILTGRKLFLLTAMLAAAVMLLGKAGIRDDAFITLRVTGNFVNVSGLRSGHYFRVYQADIYGAQK